MDEQSNNNEKLNRTLKIVLAVLWLAVFCLLLFFIWTYFRNAGIIENYNAGNSAFKDENYELAKAYYGAALNEKPSRSQECKIRINEALSVTTPITPESVTYANLEQAIAELEGAKDILTEKGCANEEDDEGHNKKAQILKNEIDDYIRWLRENVKPPEDSEGGGQNSDPNPNQSPNNDKQDQDQSQGGGDQDKERQSRMDDLQKKMDEIESKGLEERNRDLSDYKNSAEGMDNFGGKNW